MLLSGLLLTAATVLQAAEIKVLSSTALKSVLEELGPQFEKATGHKVAAQFAPAADLKSRIEKGEAFDVARAGAGVAIRKGAPKPDLSSAESFKRALLEAKSVAYVGTGATAANMRNIFARLGIVEEMKAKTKLLSGIGAADAVAKGEAELGFTQVSEILGNAGAELAGPLPPEVQVYTVFPAAGAASAREPGAAVQFLRYLKTPDAAKVIRAKGMEPG